MQASHLVTFVALTALLKTWGCPDSSGARAVLEAEGYTAVETSAWRGWSCGRDDQRATGFCATTAAGRRASGVVCSGLFAKAYTVRLDRPPQALLGRARTSAQVGPRP